MGNPKFHRTLSVLTAFLLIISLTACGDYKEIIKSYYEATQNDSGTETDSESEAQQTTAAQSPEHHEEDAAPRDYRVTPRGNGEDVVTVMFYLCGSDLESWGGAATQDLLEILDAEIADNVNIIVETGGADEWFNTYVEPYTNERWQMTERDMEFLEDAGLKKMSDGKTLSDFIKYCASNFPADRYMLVLWDHGGGPVGGYAYDERFDSDSMMPLTELNYALADAGVVFDMIGFDCCLMSTAETAFMVEKYADFMVASQRVMPGEGLYYTPWITALSQNTSIPTLELGKIIADSFVSVCSGGYYGNELTMAVTDLTYIPGLFRSMNTFFENARDSLVYDSAFATTSKSLGASRAMNDNYDLVDLAHLLRSLRSMDGSEDVLACLQQCVVYNNATIKDYEGLCLYFPYTDLSQVSQVLDIYQQIGISESYQSFITTFANVMVGGQVYNNGGADNPFADDSSSISSWLDFLWVDESLFDEWDWFYEDNCYDGSELEVYYKDGSYVLSLSDEDWDIVVGIKQRVFLDDGEGYIDLGSDAMYEFNDDGDLLIEFDNTWVALDGELVCYYTLEDVYEYGYWYTYGAVPVLYNGRDAEILIMWDSDYPGGYVMGWRYTTTGSGSQRGLFALENGMTFDIVCDYYTYDGYFDDQYLWGSITINGPVEVSYEDVGEADCLVYYEIYDIYRNSYWTESVIFYS